MQIESLKKSSLKVLKKNAELKSLGSVDIYLKKYAWTIRLDHTFKLKPKPFTRPRIKQIFGFLPAAFR